MVLYVETERREGESVWSDSLSFEKQGPPHTLAYTPSNNNQVNFPPALLYADPTGATYKSVGFYKEFGRLFFARATARAFQDKEKQERVKALLPSYKPGKLIPKDTALTVQQGAWRDERSSA